MDQRLLKDRSEFLKRAATLPAVERKASSSNLLYSRNTAFATNPSGNNDSCQATSSSFDYKAAYHSMGRTSAKFEVLSKIVRYMMKRRLSGDNDPITILEIIEEMNDPTLQLETIPSATLHWLDSEALPGNPKIEVHQPDESPPSGYNAFMKNELKYRQRYSYKPKYDIRRSKDLRALLQRHLQQGLGGILKEDLEECLASVDDALIHLRNEIVLITRPLDKKVIIFAYDKSLPEPVEEGLLEYWRAAAVEGVSENTIEEHLKKVGISTISGEKKSFVPAASRTKKQGRRQKRMILRDNQHLQDTLIDYSDQFRKD